MKKTPLFAILAAMASVAVAQDAAEAIAPEAVAEVNKAVATHVAPTAKGLVEADIAEYCKEAGITIGAPTPSGALYLKGIERVTANVASPNFIRARSVAFARAYQRAVASYVMDKFGQSFSTQYDTYFRDESSNKLRPDENVKDMLDRIAEKSAQLTEAQLDEGLRKMGVTPSGSPVAKRTLMKNTLLKESIRKAVGSSAGLMPVQTFEGWDESGSYAIGVVIRGGVDTETIAECLRLKMRPALVRPDAGMSVDEALPTDAELVSQMGVRMFFDKDGVPALLSFGQWGSGYAGSDPDMAEEALDHALEQAEMEADDQLTTFINSTISVAQESQRGEENSRSVLFDANQVPTEQAITDYIDRIGKSSTMKGSDTMIGRSTVMKKTIDHPTENGHKIAVCVRMWSFGQYDAMKRIVDKRPPAPAPATQPKTDPGVRRGRSYDF